MSIKDFSILTKLGQGAYSSVYKVQRLSDSNEYALKKVKLGNLSQKQLQNALNEVRILASIKSPHIVSYKQAFLEGKSLCIVMEFADAGDLYQKITSYKKKKKFFEENEIWSVLIQMTKALKTLHDLNILHRDLKSANVFLASDGGAKLGDMNVSKIAKNGLLYTQTGTPYYASPEVWKDQPYDSKSDIWSFGCVIYEMTTLQPPFKAEDMQGLFKSVTEGVYPPIPNIYSKELSSIIKMMLQQKPSNRPSTEKLLKSSLLSRKAKQLNIPIAIDQKAELLKTIRIPKKLHYLTDRLPKSNYEVLKTCEDYPTGNRSVTQGSEDSVKQRKSTLPRLDNIIRYHEDMIKKQLDSKKVRSREYEPGNLLIEGRSKIIAELKGIQYHRPKLRERSQDVHTELKKIQNGRYKISHDKYLKDRVLPPIKY